MDPRLNGVPNRMGLVAPYLEEYKKELHNIHFEWYKRARNHTVMTLRAAYDAENLRTAAMVARTDALRNKRTPTMTNNQTTWISAPNPDMGFEPDSDDECVVITASPVRQLGPPEIPLLSRENFIAESIEAYRAYKNACKMLPWATMYSDPKYRIVPGANWQELLYDVDLAPVWKALDELNRGSLFRFFPIMARYSKASVYKLQASSFCERVNSAGKIVFSDSNLSLASEKVEQRTMLRMNKKWMAHMRKHYPDCTADLMIMLRQSHDALAPLVPEANDDD